MVLPEVQKSNKYSLQINARKDKEGGPFACRAWPFSVMTVSRFGSGFGRAIFFSGFLSCFMGIFCSDSSSAASFVAILRDVRGGARRLPGASFPVDVSEPSLVAVISVILATECTLARSREDSSVLPLVCRDVSESCCEEMCEYDGGRGNFWVVVKLVVDFGSSGWAQTSVWIVPPRNPTLSHAEAHRRFNVWPE